MKGFLCGLAAVALLAGPARAQHPAKLRPELAGLEFLLGTWTNGHGVVADTHGTSIGTSTFSSEAGGTVILRRDHTDLQDGSGHPIGGFDQLMTIYAAGAARRAEYFDPGHRIVYTSVTIDPGKSVVFATAPAPGPNFRLSYAVQPGSTLGVEFAMAPPGSTEFHDIAKGTMQKMMKP